MWLKHLCVLKISFLSILLQLAHQMSSYFFIAFLFIDSFLLEHNDISFTSKNKLLT